MFTNLYCVINSAAWIAKLNDDPKYDVVLRSAVFDILSRGADKIGIVVDRSKGFAHYFRPLVGDVIRASSMPADKADIEVVVYRWTGDEVTATNFKPVGGVFLSYEYPRRGGGQGLGFGSDDELIVLKDAYPEWHSGPTYGPTTEELTGSKDADLDLDDDDIDRKLLRWSPHWRAWRQHRRKR